VTISEVVFKLFAKCERNLAQRMSSYFLPRIQWNKSKYSLGKQLTSIHLTIEHMRMSTNVNHNKQLTAMHHSTYPKNTVIYTATQSEMLGLALYNTTAVSNRLKHLPDKTTANAMCSPSSSWWTKIGFIWLLRSPEVKIWPFDLAR